MRYRGAFIAVVLSLLILASPAWAVKTYNCTALTGGASRALDSYGVATLSDGDRAIVADSNDEFLYFEYQSSATDAEETTNHPFRVRPDDYSSSGVWYEQMPRIVADRASQNLLTNPDFEVWSNGTLENVGSELITADDDSTFAVFGNVNWIGFSGGTVADGTGKLEVTTDASGASGTQLESGHIEALIVGHLYRFKVDVWQDTTAVTEFRIYINYAAEADSSVDITIGAGQATFEFVFEAKETSADIRIYAITSDEGKFFIDDALLYEVTPGCVAADSLGPDGWKKDSTLDVYREPNGSNTKEGAYYALKLSPTAVSDYMLWPSGHGGSAHHYEKYAGKTVTLGLWVKTSTVNQPRLWIADGSNYYSSYHTGGGDWEWLELSQTISATPSQAGFGVIMAKSSGDVYISQPILVFGSSIGEGNYSKPSGGWIYCESPFMLTGFAGDAFSAVGTSTTINLEAVSDGKVSKGCKAVLLNLQCQDSNTSGNAYFALRDGLGDEEALLVILSTVDDSLDDKLRSASGIVVCGPEGDIKYKCNASGSNTLDVSIKVLGVQLR